MANEHQEVHDPNAEETSNESDANPLDGGASGMDTTVRFSEQCHSGVSSEGTHLTSVRWSTPVSIVCPVGGDGRPLASTPFLLPVPASAKPKLIRFADDYAPDKKAVGISYYPRSDYTVTASPSI